MCASSRFRGLFNAEGALPLTPFERRIGNERTFGIPAPTRWHALGYGAGILRPFSRFPLFPINELAAPPAVRAFPFSRTALGIDRRLLSAFSACPYAVARPRALTLVPLTRSRRGGNPVALSEALTLRGIR